MATSAIDVTYDCQCQLNYMKGRSSKERDRTGLGDLHLTILLLMTDQSAEITDGCLRMTDQSAHTIFSIRDRPQQRLCYAIVYAGRHCGRVTL